MSVRQLDPSSRQTDTGQDKSRLWRAAPPPTPLRVQDALESMQERQFVELTRAYSWPLGLASADEVSESMRRHCEQPISVLARLIVRRSIVTIVWRSRILVPLFQFSNDMAVLPSVTGVLAELESVFDDWEIAQWFAQRNAWLHDRRPMESVVSDGPAVVQAARADRYVASG